MPAQVLVVRCRELVLMHVQHHLCARRRSFEQCSVLHLHRRLHDVHGMSSQVAGDLQVVLPVVERREGVGILPVKPPRHQLQRLMEVFCTDTGAPNLDSLPAFHEWLTCRSWRIHRYFVALREPSRELPVHDGNRAPLLIGGNDRVLGLVEDRDLHGNPVWLRSR